MKFPNNKKFAFTIIDDTDGATTENVKPVYDFLFKLGLKTTKTVWIFPPRDKFKGSSLGNYRYRQFINKLQRQKFEIALHSVGSGKFTRQDTLDGLDIFKNFIGHYPHTQINHAQNPDGIYWGIKRLTLLKPFWRWSRFQGDNSKSPYFWGDYTRKYIKYARNFTFKNLNILVPDKIMPYRCPSKPHANYWFSAADGADVNKFIKLTTPANIDRLEKEGGMAIIYTHFASGFVKNGRLNHKVQNNLTYLSQKAGWFAPAGELLDYLLRIKKQKPISPSDIRKLELKWIWYKFIEKFVRIG